MKKSKMKIRSIAMIVITSILVSNCAPAVHAEMSNSNIVNQTYEEDGVEYTLTYSYQGDDVSVTISSDQDKDYYVLQRNDDEVSVVEYEYTRTTFWGQDKYEEEVIYDSEDDTYNEDNLINLEASYGSKVSSIIKNHSNKSYWYQKKSTSKNTYFRIGCSARYEINYNKLSSTYQNYLNNFVSNLNKSNSSISKAKVAGGIAVVIDIITLIVYVASILPQTAIIGMICSVFGLAATSAYFVYDAYSYYLDAVYYYDIVKVKGKKY